MSSGQAVAKQEEDAVLVDLNIPVKEHRDTTTRDGAFVLLGIFLAGALMLGFYSVSARCACSAEAGVSLAVSAPCFVSP